MTVTPADLRLQAPEFAATDDVTLQLFITQAKAFVSSNAWSTRYDIGVTYLALHLATVARNTAAGIAGAGAGAATPVSGGAVKWLASDSNQAGFDHGAASLGNGFTQYGTDSWYQSTPYGQSFQSLRRMVFSGRVIPNVTGPIPGLVGWPDGDC